MRNNTLLKWAQGATSNNKNHKADNGKNRNWIHPPDALQRGHIAYLVKFLGSTRVEQPKGIEVVKEGIRKLKFCEQLRKAEGGGAGTGKGSPKVELTISVDGVAVQEPKGARRVLHQYPLHRISYCADDKGEKRFFSFIAKEADSDVHMCFVFVSDKLAEEITLTIGQAFELAYRRFLETSGKDLAVQQRLVALQGRTRQLEAETTELRRRLRDLAALTPQAELREYLRRQQLSDIADTSAVAESVSPGTGVSENLMGTPEPMYVSSSGGSTASSDGVPASPPPSSALGQTMQAPPVPPRSFEVSSQRPSLVTDLLGQASAAAAPFVGTRLQGLLLDEDLEDEDDDFNPRAHENINTMSNGHLHVSSSQPCAINGNTAASVPPPLIAPPPKPPRETRRSSSSSQLQNGGANKDLFDSEPFNPRAGEDDPFGMGDFTATSTQTAPSALELASTLSVLDQRILEMKDGFSRGLSFGNDDFSLESLDPLKN